MGLRGITVSLDGGRLSDLYFNFEHPQRDKLYAATDGKKGGDISDEELAAANLADAREFAGILGIPESHREEFVAELVEDFCKRI